MAFEDIVEQAQRAKSVSRVLASLNTDEKNKIISCMADHLIEQQDVILQANAKDLEAAQENGLTEAMIDRLRLTSERIAGMSEGLRIIVGLTDPVGLLLESVTTDDQLKIDKVRVPIGVIGIIYESRPNVTADVAGLCIKSGNAVILKGGREAFASNQAIVTVLHQAVESCGADTSMVQLIAHTDRAAVDVLLQQKDDIDLIIPRGGQGLIAMVAEKSTIPVLKHYQGICHVYVDASADFVMADHIVVNAKCQRPAVCNAVETVLVHRDIAARFLPQLATSLTQHGVTMIGCSETSKVLSGLYDVQTATEEDWTTEYLDLRVSIRVVDDVYAAVDHVNQFGSGHSDAIVAQDEAMVQVFLQQVDSATVYHNASTRFTDGFAFGKGAEMGISTDKLHARGPVGLEELTTYKYQIFGQGQVRG